MNDVTGRMRANGRRYFRAGFAFSAVVFAIFVIATSALPFEALAADLKKDSKVAEPESLLDTIFGPVADCLPKKPFYYDLRAKQSRYGDEIGVLEKLGAVGEQMKDFPEFYEFKIVARFRGLDVDSIYLPTVFGGYGIVFDHNLKRSDLSNNRYFRSLNFYKLNERHNTKPNNAYIIQFNISKMVYNCPETIEAEDN